MPSLRGMWLPYEPIAQILMREDSESRVQTWEPLMAFMRFLMGIKKTVEYAQNGFSKKLF